MNSPIQVLFPCGKTNVSFDFHIKDDKTLEGQETFNVSIDPLSLPFGVALSNISTAEIIILDDDSKFRLFYNNILS